MAKFEYIERGVASDAATYAIWNGRRSMHEVSEAIRRVPAADVEPVRHGKWNWKHKHRGGFRRYTGVDDYGEMHTITVDERIEVDEPYCPFCGKLNESVFLNYCPNCGAKMDKGEKGECLCDTCQNNSECTTDDMASCAHGRNIDGVGDYKRKDGKGNA